MKYKLRSFFAGRNGMDALSKLIVWPALVLMLLSSFISIDWLHSAVYLLSLCAVFYAFFRVFSRDLEKRRRENQAFLSYKNFCYLKIIQRKTHKLFRCPQCGATLRVPRGKGKVLISCKQCGSRFARKT